MKSIKTLKKETERKKLNRYAGQWLAFIEDKIVANSDTLDGLTQKIDAQGLGEEASVFLVPRKDEGPYVLFVL